MAFATLCCAFTGHAHAEGQRITVVDSGATEYTARYVKALRQRLGDGAVSVIAVDQLTTLPLADSLYVAVGEVALQTLLAKNVTAPVLSVFLAKLEYLNAAAASAKSSDAKLSAIFADPSPSIQLKLVSLLFPRAPRVGVVLGQASSQWAADLTAAGRDNEVAVTVETVASADELYAALAKLSQTDAVLAVPDSQIYNKETLRTILLSTYRRGQALIGYSPGMVKAGALATVSCGVDQIAEQTMRWIADYEQSGRVPNPQHCDNYDVFLNERVLTSLELTAPPKEVLLRQLQEREDKKQ